MYYPLFPLIPVPPPHPHPHPSGLTDIYPTNHFGRATSLRIGGGETWNYTIWGGRNYWGRITGRKRSWGGYILTYFRFNGEYLGQFEILSGVGLWGGGVISVSTVSRCETRVVMTRPHRQRGVWRKSQNCMHTHRAVTEVTDIVFDAGELQYRRKNLPLVRPFAVVSMLALRQTGW